MHKILDIPSIIIQGRYDMICPPGTAELIHRLWPNSNLVMVSKAGRNVWSGITAALVKATEQFRTKSTYFSNKSLKEEYVLMFGFEMTRLSLQLPYYLLKKVFSDKFFSLRRVYSPKINVEKFILQFLFTKNQFFIT